MKNTWPIINTKGKTSFSSFKVTNGKDIAIVNIFNTGKETIKLLFMFSPPIE